jgi:DNA-binding NarL/FixJ family response regulator
MKKILIVDDYPLVMKALQAILENAFPGHAVVEALSIDEMRHCLDKAQDNTQGDAYALAIIDQNLASDSAPQLIKDLWVGHGLPTLIITEQFDYQRCREYQVQGAAGYLQKNAKIDDIITAVKIVLLGGQSFPIMQASKEVPAGPTRFNWLTRRQQQVLDLVVDGRPNKYIAAELGIGEGHVRNMVSQLFDNFEVTGRSRTHLTAIVSKLRVAHALDRRAS